MKIVRRYSSLNFGERIGNTWYPPRMGGRGFRQRWANPNLYQQRRKRPHRVSRYRDHFADNFVEFCFYGGMKRVYRGAASILRADSFVARAHKAKKTFGRDGDSLY